MRPSVSGGNKVLSGKPYMMQLVLILACCLQSQDPVFKYTITGADEQKVVGVTADDLDLATSFGHAIIKSDQVRSVTVKGDQQTFKFADGSVLSGKLKNSVITLETANGRVEFPVDKIASIAVSAPATPIPGSIVDGVAENGVTYHLHVPNGYSADSEMPAILILHGSNMNSRAYVNTIIGAWPDLAERYVLIGINGETANKNSTPENPAYNYTYVNFAGKSKYGGYTGTDRESPALVSEVLTEIKKGVKISKLFVGGHSQGGFLTYSLTMNYPDLVDGAFPIAGGMITQAEPTAYDKEDLRAQQRKIPFAIVHAPNDPVVGYSMSTAAFNSLMDDGFPMVRLIDDTQAGHMFAMLPINQAIGWLETMTSDDPDAILNSANEFWFADKIHDSNGVANRLGGMPLSESQTAGLAAFNELVTAASAPQADRLMGSITANASNTWVSDYYEFIAKYAFAKTAKPVTAAFKKIAAEHQKPADKLFGEARGLFQQQKQAEAYVKCQEIVDKYYASSLYKTVSTWLKNRKDEGK